MALNIGMRIGIVLYGIRLTRPAMSTPAAGGVLPAGTWSSEVNECPRLPKKSVPIKPKIAGNNAGE